MLSEMTNRQALSKGEKVIRRISELKMKRAPLYSMGLSKAS